MAFINVFWFDFKSYKKVIEMSANDRNFVCFVCFYDGVLYDMRSSHSFIPMVYSNHDGQNVFMECYISNKQKNSWINEMKS